MSEAPPRHRVGLIGTGIAGSLSPALHEREAALLGLDYRYELLEDVPPAGLRALREHTGFNVTHPLKQAVIAELDDLDDEARLLGAVNTVTVEGGRLVGRNTDRRGFVTGLRHALPDAALGRVVVLGAGGAGAAVVAGLVGEGTAVVVTDVDPDRARGLAARTGATAVRLDDLTLAGADGLVNATPIGMVGHPGLPLDPAVLRPDLWVAEVVYRPRRTALLDAAARLGARTVDGTAMLVAQAAASLAQFTGATPDLERMRTHAAVLASDREHKEEEAA